MSTIVNSDARPTEACFSGPSVRRVVRRCRPTVFHHRVFRTSWKWRGMTWLC